MINITTRVCLILRLIMKLDSEEGAIKNADDADERSVFVQNVHFSSTPQELMAHFNECGEVKRITIPVDKLT